MGDCEVVVEGAELRVFGEDSSDVVSVGGGGGEDEEEEERESQSGEGEGTGHGGGGEWGMWKLGDLIGGGSERFRDLSEGSFYFGREIFKK